MSLYIKLRRQQWEIKKWVNNRRIKGKKKKKKMMMMLMVMKWKTKRIGFFVFFSVEFSDTIVREGANVRHFEYQKIATKELKFALGWSFDLF